MPHVYAADAIFDIQDIDLRVAADSEFASVSVTNGATSTELTIDAAGIAVGTYTLKLESFGFHDGNLLVLKTDTVTISVVLDPTPEPQLPLQTITSGKKTEWSISSIFKENDSPRDVLIIPDPLLARYITLSKDSKSIIYDGELV